MEQPALVIFDDEPDALRALADALERRFGADYRVLTAGSSAAGLTLLEHLARQGTEVALVAADHWMPDMTGLELLRQGHELHPGAQRALLVGVGVASAEPLLRATALGQIDFSLVKPWVSPEEWLYPQVQEALTSWAKSHRPGFALVTLVGEQWSKRSHELRDLLTRSHIPFAFYDAETAEGNRLLAERELDAASLPVAILHSGQVLVSPSNIDLAAALGAPTRPDTGSYDVAIIGAGPAGLAAAVSGSSEGLRTVVIEHEAIGGQAGTSALIRNYLGFPRGIGGSELTDRACEQAVLFGTQFIFMQAATALQTRGNERVVTLSDGNEVVSCVVVIATGVSYRHLGIPNLERLAGRGVFYGAARAEARAMAGQEVFVIGAGNSAGQAALHLARYAARVTLLVRGASLGASMSDYLVKEIDADPKVEVRIHTRVVDGRGEHLLARLVLEDTRSGQQTEVSAEAVFILIGASPQTDWLHETLQRDADGYILTGKDVRPDQWPLSRPPLPLESSVPGVFAVGDVSHGSVKRVASAVGEGSVAIRFVHEYLTE